MTYTDSLLTTKEVAKIAKVTRRTVYNWILNGLLEAKRSKTGRVRIRIEDLASFLEIDPEDLVNKQIAE